MLHLIFLGRSNLPGTTMSSRALPLSTGSERFSSSKVFKGVSGHRCCIFVCCTQMIRAASVSAILLFDLLLFSQSCIVWMYKKFCENC